MPLEEEAAPKQAVEFDQAINYVNKIKVSTTRRERKWRQGWGVEEWTKRKGGQRGARA